MLRWLALSAVLANGLMYLWFGQQEAPAQVPQPGVYAPAGGKLQLVESSSAASSAVAAESAGEPSRFSDYGSEVAPPSFEESDTAASTSSDPDGAWSDVVSQGLAEQPLDGPVPPVAEDRVEDGEPAPAIPVCTLIGPLPEQVSARQLRGRLVADGISADLYRLKVPSRTDYWVYLGPMRSRREALDQLRELQQNGVDSFIISEGELANGISLGFFTRESSAQRAMQERRDQGYDASVRAVERFNEELWAVLGAEQTLDDDVWRRLQQGMPALEQRKNFCDVIASAEKFE